MCPSMSLNTKEIRKFEMKESGDVSTLKGPYFSFSRPGFSPQHPHIDSLLSVNSFLGILYALLTSLQTRHVWGAYIPTGKTYLLNKINRCKSTMRKTWLWKFIHHQQCIHILCCSLCTNHFCIDSRDLRYQSKSIEVL